MEDPLRAAADDPDLRLIETLLWDGTHAPRAALHLTRLQRSAARFGWPCPAVTLTGPPTPARLRLTLDRSGQIDMTTTALPPAAALWRVGLAAARLASGDPWLQVKSSRRAIYDTARANLPVGLEEVIFRNERDEICDGTITTVFFDRGEGLRTPPLSAGVLPGVLRAQIRCPEEHLHVTELQHVRLWVGNALRGLIPAEYCGS
ncbi:MAG: aminotransferase class IV family protein [Roseinatronobacter sp.]